MKAQVTDFSNHSPASERSGHRTPIPAKPPGPMKPMDAITPPPPPPMADPQPAEARSAEHANADVDDDGVTRRVWAKAIHKSGKTPDDITPRAPYIYRKYAQRNKQAAVSSAGRAALEAPARHPESKPPRAPLGVRRSQPPSGISAAPSVPPPAKKSGLDIDEDAKTEELVIKKIVSIMPRRKTDEVSSTASTSDSAVVTVVAERPIGPDRTTDLSALGRATIRAAEPTTPDAHRRFPWIRRWLSRLTSPLLKMKPAPAAATTERLSADLLDGIHPKYMRAAVSRVTPQLIENQDWQVEVAKSSEGSSVSFLNSSLESGGKYQIVPRHSPRHFLQDGPTRKIPRRYSRVSVGAFSGELRSRSAGLAPHGQRFAYALFTPPQIMLRGALLRKEGSSSLILRGRATHPVCVRDVMVFADDKKILFLSNASRDNAGYIEFSADIPLSDGLSRVLVVARHNDEVMGSQSLFVRPSGKAGRLRKLNA